MSDNAPKREWTKEEMLEEFKRRESGYRLLEMERLANLHKTDTASSILMLAGITRHALRTLPLRKESGLVEFYRILSKTRS